MDLLVKYSSNWADEMDIDGFCVMEREEWDRFVTRVHKHFEQNSEVTHYIGTNEEIVYEDADQLLQCYEVIEITPEHAEVLRLLFGGGRRDNVAFGFTGPDVE